MDRHRYSWAQVLAALFILFASIEAHAGPRLGLDITGLGRQDVGMIAREIAPGTAVGALEGTFGAALPGFKQLHGTGKVKEFRLALINATCYHVTPNRCERGEPKLTDWATMAARARAYGRACTEMGDAQCWVAPWLEHSIKDRATIKRAVDTIRDAAPNLRVMLIPDGIGAVLPGLLVERHGNTARGDFISNDGAILWDADTSKYCQGAKEVCFGWIPRCNLRLEKSFVPPSRRPLSSRLRAVDIRQMQLVLRRPPPLPGAIPPGCSKVRPLMGRELWKSNSEDGVGSKDPRWGRSVLIWKNDDKRLPIIDPSGREIGCLGYFGTYSPYGPGWHRAYIGYRGCSPFFPVEMYDRAAGEWMYVKRGKNCIPVNAIRRQGNYR